MGPASPMGPDSLHGRPVLEASGGVGYIPKCYVAVSFSIKLCCCSYQFVIYLGAGGVMRKGRFSYLAGSLHHGGVTPDNPVLSTIKKKSCKIFLRCSEGQRWW